MPGVVINSAGVLIRVLKGQRTVPITKITLSLAPDIVILTLCADVCSEKTVDYFKTIFFTIKYIYLTLETIETITTIMDLSMLLIVGLN